MERGRLLRSRERQGAEEQDYGARQRESELCKSALRRAGAAEFRPSAWAIQSVFRYAIASTVSAAPEVHSPPKRVGAEAQVTLSGVTKTWVRVADSGRKATYRFCADCGSTVTYEVESWPGLTAVPIGAFADPTFPPPKFSVYEHRKHPWTMVVGDDVEHSSLH